MPAPSMSGARGRSDNLFEHRPAMHRLRQDLELTLRRLRRRPGFTLAALATLAIGLGANIAVFSLVRAVLLTPPPYEDPDRLFVLFEEDTRQGRLARVPVAATTWSTWRSADDLFAGVAAYSSEDVIALADDGSEERLRGARVSATLFEVLGVGPERGRGFEPSEDRLGGARSVVISHGLWQRRFGGGDDILGQRLVLEDGPVTVVGVMPAGFAFPAAVDLWAPVGPEIEDRQWMRGLRWLGVVARLRADIAVESVDERLRAVDRRLLERHPDVSTGYRSRALTLAEEKTGPLRSTLWLLQAAVILVLGVAVANLANLLLTQAVERRRELAVRVALGAGWRQLLRQLVTESTVLVASGAILGLLLATALVTVLARLGAQRLPAGTDVGLDPAAVTLGLVLVLPVAAILAVATTLYATRRDLAQALRGSGQGTAAGGGGGALRSTLVAAEVAAALVLLIGAASAIQGYWRLSQVDPGFDTADTAVVRLTLSRSQFPDRVQRAAILEQLVDRLQPRAVDGRLAFASQVPLVGAIPEFEVRANDQASDPDDLVFTTYQAVGDAYFRTLQIPLLSGRGFDARDHSDAPPVVILGEALAQRLFGAVDPVGRQITLELGQPSDHEVVGVVADVRQALSSTPQASVYVPLRQSPPRNLTLVVATAPGQAEALGPEVATVIEEEARGRPVLATTTLATVLAGHLAQVRLGSMPLLTFAAIALFLGLVGVHGVVGFTVVQRRREIALRQALGARRREVVVRVVLSALRPLAIGVLVGWLGAWALQGLMARWLQGTGSEVHLGFALLVAGVLALAAVLAALVPARRALAVEPMQVLREDG